MKPDLTIKNPFDFRLEVESSTDSPKGFRCKIAFSYETPRKRIDVLLLDNWIEQAVFDEFLEAADKIRKGHQEEAVLHDCDRELFYRISPEKIEIETTRYGLSDNVELKLEVEATTELIALTANSLGQFPKWW